MKVNKSIRTCSMKKTCVVFAISLLLYSSVSLASPSWYNGNEYVISHLINPPVKPPVTEWIHDKSIGNVDFYHAVTVCNGNKVVFLKFNNRNRYPVKITWKEIFRTRSAENKESFAGKKEMQLSPGITAPKDCADAENKKNILLPEQVDPASITEIVDFSFREITVNAL